MSEANLFDQTCEGMRLADLEDKTMRRRRLLRLLEGEGFSTVASLGRRLKVSEPTIRRDLLALEGAGLLTRVRGGAVAKGTGESPFGQRMRNHAVEKQAIAARACQYIKPGQRIGLDIGTTMVYLAQRISERSAQFVTSGLRTARALSHAGLSVVVTGGALRAGEDSLVGPVAKRSIRSYRFDAFFLSLACLTPQGAFDVNLDEIEVKQEFILHSGRVYALIDSSKITRQATGLFATDLRAITAVITDRHVSRVVLPMLEEAGLRVIIANGPMGGE